MLGTKDLVQILGTKLFAPTAWYQHQAVGTTDLVQILGIRFLAPRAWYRSLGANTWYQVRGLAPKTWYKYLVPCSWYQVRGTTDLVQILGTKFYCRFRTSRSSDLMVRYFCEQLTERFAGAANSPMSCSWLPPKSSNWLLAGA